MEKGRIIKKPETKEGRKERNEEREMKYRMR